MMLLSNLKNIINHEKHKKRKYKKWKMKKSCTSDSIEISICGNVFPHKKGMSFPRKRESRIVIK